MRRCRKVGHDWFPDIDAGEFLPQMAKCLRCGEETVILPWGQCLTGHPLAEHYNALGEEVPHWHCPGPC
jgi:hypothetical protein